MTELTNGRSGRKPRRGSAPAAAPEPAAPDESAPPTVREGAVAKGRRRGARRGGGQGRALPLPARGASINPVCRFDHVVRSLDEEADGEDRPAPATTVQAEKATRIISRNDSPDLGFDRSINPYRGCEHGCVYCFARPTHAYLNLSPGIDFETRLSVKTNAAELLRRELSARGYRAKTMVLGGVTDAYQPIEREHRQTRAVLEVLATCGHPVAIVTKSALVVRDADLLSQMAERGLAKVAISLTTLDPELARRMEPRAAAPRRRLAAMEALARAGIPVQVMVAPIVPAINDAEIERLLEAAREAGASEAGYVLLRLPHEVVDIFSDWLARHYPDRARRVMQLMRSMRGGKDYDSQWGVRLTGEGPFATLVARRFELATRRVGLATERTRLRTDLFVPPTPTGEVQLALL